MNHHHVKSVIASCVQNIQEKEECLWWIHQDMLLDWLGVDYNGLDKQIVISLLLKFIKKGKLCFENDDELKLPCNVVPSLYDVNVMNSLSLFSQSIRFSSNEKASTWFIKGQPKQWQSLKNQQLLVKSIINKQGCC